MEESGVRSQDGAAAVRMSDSEGGVEETDLQEPESSLRLEGRMAELEDGRGRTNSEGAEVEEQVRGFWSLARTQLIHLTMLHMTGPKKYG